MPLQALLRVDEICRAFRERVDEFIECGREDDATIYLDTPFILSDGHALRVYFRQNANGSITVSDGHFATNFIQSWIQSISTRERLYGEMFQIAHDLHLKWEGEFTFDAKDVKEAVKRAAVLYRAVEQSLNAIPVERQPQRNDFTGQLALSLRKRGLHVQQHHRFGPPDDSVFVDLQVDNQRSHVAFVETISIADYSQSIGSLGRASLNMKVLMRQTQDASLFAVFNKEIGAIDANIRSKIPDALDSNRVKILSIHDAPEGIAGAFA